MKFKVGDYAKPRVWAERECPGYIELRAGYIKITNVNEDEPSYSYNVYSESGSLLYECNGCYGDSKLDSYTPTEEQSSFVEVPIGSENKIIYYDMSKNNEITIDGKRYTLEEIKEPEVEPTEVDKSVPWRADKDKEYFCLDKRGDVTRDWDTRHAFDDWRYLTGNYFQTRAEVIAHREYLEAKAVITKDAGGYEFVHGRDNYHGFYAEYAEQLGYDRTEDFYNPDIIYFGSGEAIEESQENHPKEWEIYTKYKLPKGE